MKVLVVGEGRYPLYERAFADWFSKNNVKVETFFWSDSFSQSRFSLSYWQEKFRFGPLINTINKELVDKVDNFKPDFVFLYRCVFINHETIIKIKNKTLVLGYNNDDPFSDKYHKRYWDCYLKSSLLYDHVFSYREKNVEDYIELGVDDNHVSLLLPYYIKSKDYHESSTKKRDVVFIGHFENDGRDYLIYDALVRGVNVEVYGTGWIKSSIYSKLVDLLGKEIHPIYGDEYRDTINTSYISIIFLSKLNNDNYTRRCFEIPAAGSVIYCEYNDVMIKLWPENECAFYFDNECFTDKLLLLLKDKGKLIEVESNARQKLLKGGGEVGDRCIEVINKYYDYI